GQGRRFDHGQADLTISFDNSREHLFQNQEVTRGGGADISPQREIIHVNFPGDSWFSSLDKSSSKDQVGSEHTIELDSLRVGNGVSSDWSYGSGIPRPIPNSPNAPCPAAVGSGDSVLGPGDSNESPGPPSPLRSAKRTHGANQPPFSHQVGLIKATGETSENGNKEESGRDKLGDHERGTGHGPGENGGVSLLLGVQGSDVLGRECSSYGYNNSVDTARGLGEGINSTRGLIQTTEVTALLSQDFITETRVVYDSLRTGGGTRVVPYTSFPRKLVSVTSFTDNTSGDQVVADTGRSLDDQSDRTLDDPAPEQVRSVVLDNHLSDWDAGSSSGSEHDYHRLRSLANSNESLTAVFSRHATLPLKLRADRTLTGSHHNLDVQQDDFQHLASSQSAPNSSRRHKPKSGVKFLARAFFKDKSESISDVTYEITETRFVNSLDDIKPDGAASSRAKHWLASDGRDVARGQSRVAGAPTHTDTQNDDAMLSSRNHDHELLPPSALGPHDGRSGHYATGSLARSKSLFSSTPSLFVKSTPEDKFWKKEMKREKEERKRLEEERKRREKEEKKRLEEEKKRRKMLKKSATVSGKNSPRDRTYVIRPIENIYSQPQFRMRAVHIDYQDDPRLPPPHQPPPPPPGHYATARMALRDGYSIYASTPDMARVEQVYGTTTRRPTPVVPPSSHYAAPYGYVDAHTREQRPRVVLLHRSAEGYGFVLRGAKSKIPTGGGFNDFTPTPEYPALQYLDSVDPGSQADRAGLKGGDFIIEINGENVVRASHEHVVHLIRSSSDILTLKVITVTPTDRTPADWLMHADGAMTLPARKKQAAPLPPQRDPRTSLSFSKASSKSMTEGLAEIEKLDAAIAEFEGQESIRRHSLHGLQAADDPKVASIRGSHTVKRVSVVDYESLISGEPSRVGDKEHVSPAEARIKKYHKKSASQSMERSKSTPDIISALESQYDSQYAMTGIHTGNHLGGKTSGTWTKNRAPPPPPHTTAYTGTLQASSSDPPYLMAAVGGGSGAYGRAGHAATPELPDRRIANQRTSPGAPATPEVVRINTGVKSSNYANVRSEIESGISKESSYESSFRPGANAKLVDSSKGSLQAKKNSPNMDRNITFADDRVMENAQKFIQKHPNATLLVTADIHLDDPVSGKKNKEETLYEPEPDYDSGDERSSPARFQNSMSAPRSSVDGINTTNVVRQNKSSVTVISISSDSNKGANKPPAPHSSPSSGSSHRSSPIFNRVQDKPITNTPGQKSQPSSAESSRRSSVQSNLSSEGTVDRNGRMQVSSAPPPPPPPGPPPPPPPPIQPLLGTSPTGSTNSTLSRRHQNDVASALPGRISAEDIMAAVAERKSRLEVEGPRLLDVKPISTSKSTHELNQEALKAAVALRKSRLEQNEDKSVLDEIEARLNRNKKLQAAKFLGGDPKRTSEIPKKEEPKANSSAGSAVASTVKSEDHPDSSVLKPKDLTPGLEPKSTVALGKVSPVASLKSTNNTEKASTAPKASLNAEIGGTIDFRSRLKPVDVKSSNSSVSLQPKGGAPASATTPATATTQVTAPTSPKNKTASAAPLLPMGQKSNASAVPVSETIINSSIMKPQETVSPAVTSSSADYIALAEKARQEYLKKKASGNLQSHIEKKGPVEITPSRKNTPGSPTAVVASKPTGMTLIDVKPAKHSGEKVHVTKLDNKDLSNGKANVAVIGVTEDHSHTEQSLSNGTMKKPKSNGNTSPPPGLIPAPHHGTQPMDNASFVSSVSSLSTLSSEPGDGGHHDGRSIEDLIAPPPPPPLDYDDLGDQDAFIPPPPQFLEIDSNANESQTMDKNSKPFATKSVSSWSCLDVLDWLDSLGLPQYRVSFAKACVDGSKLVDMGRNEFINLGVTQVGHRMSLERSVKKLNMGASTNL
ncbi:unnamed protein product, partial [Lymnaea stagnalis]